jgi:ATP-dependent DNA helicase RecQ
MDARVSPMSISAVSLDPAREALHRVFGFADFRPGQAEILQAILSGENVLAVMPTGSGKSLLFQLPALLNGGLTVVVSPLIALMRDQVAQMRNYGIEAAALNSAADANERRAIFEGLESGKLRLLYVAPERLLRDDTLSLLDKCKIDLLAIDEAHCVSQWGHDFRPEYIRLKEAAQALGRPQTLAVTATADAPTRADISQRLFFEDPRTFVRSFDRPNLHLAMRPKADPTRQLWDFLAKHAGESGIVYCASRRRTEELAQDFSSRGRRALPYHAGLDQVTRAANQDAFLQEDGVVVCATIAFGMGVDKPDVRFVAHADLPSSIESYYQEIGRAGRDGLPATTLTLYGLGDIELRRRQIREGDAPPERKRVEQDKLDDLVTLCESPRCRRQVLLGFFGEESQPCGHCDVCDGGVRTVDGKLDAQKALSAVLRTGGRFFFGHLANILSGHSTEAVARHEHDKLKTFGVGKNRSPASWQGVFRQLMSAKLLVKDAEDRDRLVLTEAGRVVLKGEGEFLLVEDVRPAKEKTARKAPMIPRDADEDLLTALKALRTAMAKAANQPAYVIFPDRTLIEMAAAKPTTIDELAEIHGIGEQKLKKFGPAFLAVLNNHA